MNARALKRFVPGGRWAVIAVPFLWLLLFFAIPFLIVLKISFSRLAIAMPPYTPILEYVDKALTVRLNLGNYVALFTDSQYVLAYLSSIKIAAVSTLLCLLIGYPMAYFIARMKPSTRNIALMGLPNARIRGLFLTHFHSDHIDGLGPMMLLRWTASGNAAPLPVYGPSGVEAVIAGFGAAYAAAQL